MPGPWCRIYKNRPGVNVIHKLNIKTSSRTEFREITADVRDIIKKSGVAGGVCYLFVPHTTAGIIINEHADPSVVEDIAARLEAIVPRQGSYRHVEGNSPAHIKASLVGDSCTLFIEGGRLMLGTWQGIFFAEFDGPRERNVLVRVVPDGVSL
jgi:secondary thiamine-phosphate synthase enzyme